MPAPITPTETVERFIAAYNRRDVERAIEVVDEHSVLMPMLAHMQPVVRPYEGYAGVRNFFAELAALPVTTTFVPSQIVADGERIMVAATIRTSTDQGVVDHPVSAMFCVHAGRIQVLQSFGSVEMARAAWEQA